ncbi:MAG: hypothetical protein K0S39_6204, partial [Paenibacillus sp.]|nr:hypothetical protein [Paenibacillus sp.]
MSLTINDFQLQKWHVYEPFTVYLGLNPASQETCWIKMLNAEYPSQQEVQWITSEYENGQLIPLEEMIKPLQLQPYNGTFLLYMEPFDGQPLSRLLASGPLEVHLFLQLSIAFTNILL